jgi:transcriptional regulator with XRE-family HTH domain
MVKFHEGKRLEQLVQSRIKKGRRNGSVKKFLADAGFSDYSGLRYHYGLEVVKPKILRDVLAALNISEDEFFMRENPLSVAHLSVDANEGKALQMLIEGKGIEKSWLCIELGISRPTLDRYLQAEKLPAGVVDSILKLYHLPGDYFRNARLDNVPGFQDLQKQLNDVQHSLLRIEQLLSRGKP